MQVTVWSKENCPQCDKAKGYLEARGIEYQLNLIGQTHTKEDLLEVIPSARSVPQIVIDGDVIGGYQDLTEYLKT